MGAGLNIFLCLRTSQPVMKVTTKPGISAFQWCWRSYRKVTGLWENNIYCLSVTHIQASVREWSSRPAVVDAVHFIWLDPAIRLQHLYLYVEKLHQPRRYNEPPFGKTMQLICPDV